MLDIITIGSASRDIFFITGRGKLISDPESIEGKLIAFPLGAKVSIEDAIITDGGGACNAATALARLGLKVAAVMSVGDDEMGRQIIHELDQEGAETGCIRVDKKLRTGTSVLLLPKGVGDRTVLFYSGANRNLEICDWSKLENASWFYIGPVSRQKPELLKSIVDFAHSRSIKIANNLGIGQIEQGFEYLSPILKKLDVLIVNKTEAIRILESKGGRTSDIAVSREKPLYPMYVPLDDSQLAVELIKFGPNIVVVTCGPDGSYATEGKEIYFQETIKTNVIDATGAGDSYGSTFVASLIMGHDIKNAMLMAAINSSSVVSYIGAQEGLLRLDEIKGRASGQD